MTSMRADNERKAADLAEAGVLRMSRLTLPQQQLEKDVCILSYHMAEDIVRRVVELYLVDMDLPLGYTVKREEVKGNFRHMLYRGESAVNETDPVVDLCILFHHDVSEGLIPAIEELYVKRQEALKAAEIQFKEMLTRGLDKYRTPTTTNSSPDNGVGEVRPLDRWNILGEETKK